MERLRVLVIDDERGMRLGVERALSSFVLALPDMDSEVAFDVATAADGAEGRCRLADEKPDLLLLDHKLPDCTGLDLLDELNGENADVMTIMITAYASLETAVQATKQGAYDFLAKPFTPEELRNAVRKAARHLMLQRQARRLAEEKKKVRFQFVSVLAHEMKAPIAAVEGYLQIIRTRAAGEDQAAYERMLERSMVRLQGMRKLINDLLDMTAIESGQKQRELTDLDMVALSRAAVETMLPAAQERGISMDIQAPESLHVTGDRAELEILLNNLVSNAVKYNRDSGRVTIDLADAGGQTVIRVSDTGIGMTAEECGRVFKYFSRIKNPQNPPNLGTRRGVYTVKKIAELYGGSITVSSEPDEGTTFTVNLPRPAAEMETADETG